MWLRPLGSSALCVAFNCATLQLHRDRQLTAFAQPKPHEYCHSGRVAGCHARAARLARGPDLTAARDISSVSSRSPTTSPPHVDYGSWSLAEASLPVLQSSTVAPMHVDAPVTDVRTWPERLDPRGERACALSDAVHKMEECAMHDLPIQGPRTTHWLLLEILGPVTRHHWWKQAMGLSSSDERLFLCEMLGHGTQYDQLNLPDLEMNEATQRRLQLWKERYAEKLCASTTGGVSAGHATERQLFLGGSRPNGSTLVAKELEKWVASQLAQEAAILTERRKGSESHELGAVASDQGRRNHRKPKWLG